MCACVCVFVCACVYVRLCVYIGIGINVLLAFTTHGQMVCVGAIIGID